MTTERKSNYVTLNLSESGTGKGPEEDLPPVFINGVPIHNVSAIVTSAGVGQWTEVTIKFYAQIGGFALEPVKVNF